MLFRLQALDNEFSELLRLESEWPPFNLLDSKVLYEDFYNNIHELAQNIVCASCGCIGHNESKYHKELITSDSLMNFAIDPILVPFDFGSKHVVLKDKNIMVDDLGILGDGAERSKVILCSTCHHCLTVDKKMPIDSLAN